MDRVLLAAPRGFCAGVEMAIKALAWMVRVFEPPVYCYHEIVHNQVVVDRFRQLGRDLRRRRRRGARRGPADAVGSRLGARGRRRGPDQRGGPVVNAVCPLVTKVHHEVKVRAGKGYTVVYVGHEGHDEAVGTVAVAPEAVRPASRTRPAWPPWPHPPGPVAFLAQTTLAVDEWQGVLEAAQERFPDLWVPGRSDLCFATTNRQAALQGHRRQGRRRGRDRLGQLLQHPGPRADRPARRLRRGCCGSTAPTSCPTT